MATQTEALSYTFYHVTGRHYESTVKIKKVCLSVCICIVRFAVEMGTAVVWSALHEKWEKKFCFCFTKTKLFANAHLSCRSTVKPKYPNFMQTLYNTAELLLVRVFNAGAPI